MLSAIHQCAPEARFYFAGSSEMFGKVAAPQMNQLLSILGQPTAFPGCSFHLTRNYRETYGLHTSSGILFNHESPRRGYEFVTRKITSHVASIKKGLRKDLVLGNLEAQRDGPCKGLCQSHVANAATGFG